MWLVGRLLAGTGLRFVGAFESFVGHPNRYAHSNCDGVTDEFALCRCEGRTTHALGAGAARALRVGSIRVQNDSVSSPFRDFTHVIFNRDLQGAADTLHNEFLGAQNSYFSDRGLV